MEYARTRRPDTPHDNRHNVDFGYACHNYLLRDGSHRDCTFDYQRKSQPDEQQRKTYVYQLRYRRQ
jgi:hypothetical protein